jgi:hypothetical protein
MRDTWVPPWARSNILLQELAGGGAQRLGVFAYAVEQAAPTFADALAVMILKNAETGVMERDQGATVFFAEAILDIGNERGGSEQRPGDFEERRALDGLDISPKVAVAIAEVAKPAAAGPRFEDHGHGLAFAVLILRAHFFEKGGEGRG